MIETPPEATAEPVSVAEPRLNTLAVIKQRKDWPEIHEELLMGYKPIQDICKHYDLRTSTGTLAIVPLQGYRRSLKEKFKKLFETASEIEKDALRAEYLGKIRTVYDQGARGNEMALSQQQIVKTGRGKTQQITKVDAPDHAAAREYQDSMLQAAGKIGEVVGIGPGAAVQVNAPQDNRVWNVLSLPKAPGVPNRAPLQIVEAKKETA